MLEDGQLDRLGSVEFGAALSKMGRDKVRAEACPSLKLHQRGRYDE